MSTARFIARRVGFYLVALWVAVTLDFFLTPVTPSTRIVLIGGMQSDTCDPACVRALRMDWPEVRTSGRAARPHPA
ncbi:MAG: hypothetical protein ABSE52_01295 [Candidatus Dormibacteria bacterium]|jgi:hypothetical protein